MRRLRRRGPSVDGGDAALKIMPGSADPSISSARIGMATSATSASTAGAIRGGRRDVSRSDPRSPASRSTPRARSRCIASSTTRCEAPPRGAARAGQRLPSTRAMAVELGVSRNTVVTAFEQLLAEGYLEGRVGAGTFVAPHLPDVVLRTRAAPRIARGQAPARPRPLGARRRARVDARPSPSARGAAAVPPRHAGVRRVPVRRLVAAGRAPLARADADLRRLRRPRGLPPLREAIAAAPRDRARRALRRRAGRRRLAARSRRSICRRGCCSIPATRCGSRSPATSGARAALARRRRAARAGAGRRRGLDVAAGVARRARGRDRLRHAVAPVPARRRR